MRLAILPLVAGLVLAGCQSAPEPDAEVVLGDLVVVAPARLPAGTSVLSVTNEDAAHHDLAICPGDRDGCEGPTTPIRVLAQPEEARDPGSLPDETEHLVLGGDWRAIIEVDLEPGRYRFYCAIVNHAPRGMATAVEVG